VALLPAGLLLHHVATPADLAQVLRSHCALDISPQLLKVTEVRRGACLPGLCPGRLLPRARPASIDLAASL
jgi:hypothetical protein